MDRIALADVDRSRERSGENDFTGDEMLAVRGEAVREPRDAVGWMIENTGRDPCFFNLTVTKQQGADPA